MGIHDRLSLAEEQEIIRLYREEKASVKDIVNQVNRGEKTVYRLLKRENIPRHSRKEPRWKGCDNEALVEMYLVKLMDTKEIAQQFGVSHSTIGNRLKDAGIQLRSTGVPGAMLRSGERGAQGLSRHPLYQTWNAMIQRCCVPSNKSWPNYGGAGVSARKVSRTSWKIWAKSHRGPVSTGLIRSGTMSHPTAAGPHRTSKLQTSAVPRRTSST